MRFNQEWAQEFSGIIKASPVSLHCAHCISCGLDFNINHSGRRDILSHLKTEKHISRAQLLTVKARPLTQHFPNSEESTNGPVIQAKVSFCLLIANNNLSEWLKFFSNFYKFISQILISQGRLYAAGQKLSVS